MIRFNLKELAVKLHKTVTDIANDTGLNRNTVTALYHGKVDGIKFKTLERLCSVYNAGITDLIVLEKETAVKTNGKPLIYKQEAEAALFTCWPWASVSSNLAPEYFDSSMGVLRSFFRGSYGAAYWDLAACNEVAGSAYRRYAHPDEYRKIFSSYRKVADELESIYSLYGSGSASALGEDEFIELFERIKAFYKRFWQLSLFIDSFDMGFDRDEIKRIADEYKFSIEEISVLTTPAEMTFNNERLLEMCELAKKFEKSGMTAQKFVETDRDAGAYRKKYDYYKSSYAFEEHISNDEVVNDLKRYSKNKKLFKKEYATLSAYSETRKKAVLKVLKRHRLKENPLLFFQVLTYWREHRKKTNLMGIQVLFELLSYLESCTGIKLENLKFATLDEVPGILRGLVDPATLAERCQRGAFITMEKGTYRLVAGRQAQSLRDELEESLKKSSDETILRGQTASQGYAKGKARLVLNQKDFLSFREGEILIAGMTRPEYLPVMKKAAAFVTNEGGITCHAAIVAREMGKPCIIGTRNATELIKTGDLIEVRANHGTVRILKKR
jgi:phosphohistidine swiveling domain-containing protein/DNA-binding Xre family transcriptional regulator